MSSILRLARSEVLQMKAYESARSLTQAMPGERPLIFLDANESPESPISLSHANRYPEPQPKVLVDRFCELYGVKPKEVVVGRGSDEAIDLIVRVFCRAGVDQILICPPTYGMYEISAEIQGAGITRVPMVLGREQSYLDEEAIRRNLGKGVKVIFICSPNNPTGTVFSRESLKRICKSAEDQAIVVVDEAYGEFSKDESMISELKNFPNLIVLRTLSKAWAVAGLRCGVALAQEPLISLLQKVRAPYPIPLPVIEQVLEATDSNHFARLQERLAGVASERGRLVAELSRLPQVKWIYPSGTNFILACFHRPAEILNAVKEEGLVLRDRSQVQGLEGCIRITLGTETQNNQVLDAIRKVKV